MSVLLGRRHGSSPARARLAGLAVLLMVILGAPAVAGAAEPALDSAYDTRLINLIDVRSTTSSDYLALEDLDDTRDPVNKAILSELAYGRVVAQSAPPLYWSANAGLEMTVGQTSTKRWLMGTWGTGALWQILEWPDNLGADGSASNDFAYQRRKPGDYICGPLASQLGTTSSYAFVLYWNQGYSGGDCRVSIATPAPLPGYWDPYLIPSYLGNHGQVLETPSGCPETVWWVAVDEGCRVKLTDELTLRKMIWHSNAQPWTNQTYNGNPTDASYWHTGVSTPPSDSQKRADFRQALLDPRMSELRAYINHLFEPANYQMPIPSEQTLGLCAGLNNLERNECYAIMNGDPVNTATGALVEQQTDLSLPGLGVPFELTRTYNSNAEVGAADLASPLGPKWRHNFQTRIDADAAGNAIVTATDGQQAFYEKDGSDFITPPGVRATLALASGVYTLTRSDGTASTFDQVTGELTAMHDRFGNGLTLTYGAGRLTTVTDDAGRQIDFTYDTVPAGGGTRTRLVEVELPDGRSVEYGYADTRTAPLTEVSDVLGGDTHYAYGDPEQMDVLLTPSRTPTAPTSPRPPTTTRAAWSHRRTPRAASPPGTTTATRPPPPSQTAPPRRPSIRAT